MTKIKEDARIHRKAPIAAAAAEEKNEVKAEAPKPIIKRKAAKSK